MSRGTISIRGSRGGSTMPSAFARIISGRWRLQGCWFGQPATWSCVHYRSHRDPRMEPHQHRLGNDRAGRFFSDNRCQGIVSQLLHYWRRTSAKTVSNAATGCVPSFLAGLIRRFMRLSVTSIATFPRSCLNPPGRILNLDDKRTSATIVASWHGRVLDGIRRVNF